MIFCTCHLLEIKSLEMDSTQDYNCAYISSKASMTTSMKFVTVRDLRGKTSELWKQLELERELVVTSNGKPIAIMSATDEDSFEANLWTLRRSRANDALMQLQRRAAEHGLSDLTPETIEAEINESRKERNTRRIN